MSRGGDLVSISNRAENNALESFVKKLFTIEKNFWIGLSDRQKEGVFLWSDGSTSSIRKWNSAKPNNANSDEDCVDLNYDGWYSVNNIVWNVSNCQRSYAFICKIHGKCVTLKI